MTKSRSPHAVDTDVGGTLAIAGTVARVIGPDQQEDPPFVMLCNKAVVYATAAMLAQHTLACITLQLWATVTQGCTLLAASCKTGA